MLYAFTSISNKAKNIIAKFPSEYYLADSDHFLNFVKRKQTVKPKIKFNEKGEYDEYFNLQAECFKNYESLPHEVQQRILIVRLYLFDDQTRK